MQLNIAHGQVLEVLQHGLEARLQDSVSLLRGVWLQNRPIATIAASISARVVALEPERLLLGEALFEVDRPLTADLHILPAWAILARDVVVAW